MKVLAIGNSFSQDATRYLHQIAKADGVDLTVANLFIGGCSLFRHFKNIQMDLKDYILEFNGESTDFYVSVKEALLTREWDVITLQQASNLSPDFDSYQPYINVIADYIRTYAPKAKLYIHQTWGYETGSARITNLNYNTYHEMFADVEKAYDAAFKAINADGIIRSGKLLGTLLNNGIEKIHRDTFHVELGTSRYAIGLLWYKTLTGNSIMQNTFADFDVPVSEEEVQIIKKCVEQL